VSAIRFDRISKEFPGMDRPAVDKISFEVDSGSLVVLLGPSGCGKTTTLKLMNRLYEPTAGTVYLEGTDIRDIPVTALRRQIGYVIQQIGLFPHMTVEANISVVPRLLGWPKDRIRDRVDELLGMVDLPPDQYRERYPSQLSGGQQQRVGVARALAGDPKVILMDEPFGAIDAITRSGLQDQLIQLQGRLAKTIVFVTHDVEEALRLADKIVVMRAGQIVQHDTPFNILTQPADEFVFKLVGADDMVRQLSLLSVGTAMDGGFPDDTDQDAPTIGVDEDLRHALSRLLQTGAKRLVVVEGAKAVGSLTIEDIRAKTENGSGA
jgi:osmoprotectant transport system ATP-binding protein